MARGLDYLIHHMLRSSAERFPKKEALVYKQQRLTYHEVKEVVEGLASSLCHTCQVFRGDRIGIYLDPCVAQAISIFSVSWAGGVFVPINGLLQATQVCHIANDCQMKGLITSSDKVKELEPFLNSIPSLSFLIILEEGSLSNSKVPIYSYETLSQSDAKVPIPKLSIENDLAAILYTSGSTGKPKGVMINHAQMIAGSSIVSSYLEIDSNDRILAVLPFSFDAGLNQLMTTFQQGATIILTSFVFVKEIVNKLVAEKISGLAGVPTLWNLLSQPNSSLAKQEISSLRYITNTGGVMPQPVLKKLRETLPKTRIFLMYGLTEAFRSTYLPPEELDRRPTSMGKAIPNTEILVINGQGKLCRPGEPGELVHRGPTVSMGYWGQPQLTDQVLRPNPLLPIEIGAAEKVCYSGDLVKIDEEGYLYFVGRKDNMIKSSGFRISRSEIEEVLYQSSLVRDVAVIGIPDQLLGQAIKAFVVPKDGQEIDTHDLISLCGEKLARYMVPKIIEVLDEIPKTPNGKIDYPALERREKGI